MSQAGSFPSGTSGNTRQNNPAGGTILPSIIPWIGYGGRDEMSLILRSLFVWLVFALLAVLNGTLREYVLVPLMSPSAAHVISTLLLCGIIYCTTLVFVKWIGPDSKAQSLGIGLLWVVFTLGFEFGVGHWVAGRSWTELLDDYNLAAGRIWILVLLTTFASPFLAARARGVIGPSLD